MGGHSYIVVGVLPEALLACDLGPKLTARYFVLFCSLSKLPGISGAYQIDYVTKLDAANHVIHVLLDTTYAALSPAEQKQLVDQLPSGETVIVLASPRSTSLDISNVITSLMGGEQVNILKFEPCIKNTPTVPTSAAVHDPLVSPMLEELSHHFLQVFSKGSFDAAYTALRGPTRKVTTGVVLTRGNGHIVLIGFAQVNIATFYSN